jgi:predicted amidophosphoribosyltransferase
MKLKIPEYGMCGEKRGICPVCKAPFDIYEDDEYEYCPYCGKKLDWSDEQ